ncbi:MAG: outer membrane protein assembly factor BamA [Desulfatiglandaceae bacterium]
MEGCDRGNMRGNTCSSYTLNRLGWTCLLIVLFVSVLGFLTPKELVAEERGKVAVLPFRVHASKALDHLRTGLQEMLTLRLGKLGFYMISPKVINKHPLAFLSVPEVKDLLRLGKELRADWVISGSLTQIGDKASLDIKVVDVSGSRPPFFIFMVAEDVDLLADTVKRVAVSIDHKITGVVQIDSIHVRGNQRVEKDAILAVVRSSTGDRVDLDRLDKDLRDIYKMGFFKDVKMETEDGPKGKIVTFIVTEKPSIGKIVFKGNKEVDDDDLKKEVGISLYSILDYNEIKQSINRLKEFYRQKGYYNVEIKEETEPLPDNQVLLGYDIDEHEKVYIKKVQFVGNTDFDDDELKDVMETREKWFLSWITKRGLLDKKMLEFDIHKLTSFYHNHGFIKAKVGEPKVTYDDKLDGLVVTIEIDEGPKYGIGKVSVEGEMIEPADKLLKKVQIGKEKIFNREIVRKDVLALRDVYADRGYAFADVTPIIKEGKEAHLADITYKISKGKKVRFERINITGNRRTRDKVIRRELKVIEGEYFSAKGLKQSTENLNRLGFFEDVEIKTKKGSSDDLMILDVNIKERATRTFSVGAGYSSAYSAFVMFQIADNNFLGYGQKLQATARIGAKATEYDIKFVEPWLFDRPLSLGLDAYKWSQEYSDYSRDSLGGAVNLGFPTGIDEYTRGSVMYDYDDANISDISPDASQVLKDMEGRNVTSSMTFRLRRDSKDRLWNTTKGSVNSLSFQYAGGILQGDEYFNKYRAKSTWFFPFFWDTVFLVRGQWGYVQKRSGGDLSVYQKFFLGGINTVRGFDYMSISPVDENGNRIGGEKMMAYTAEFRFPLLKEQGLVGIVFFDTGNVFSKDESWSFSGIKKSAGAGIRWYSPIGPLRLEYGRVIGRKEGESAGRWEFSVGGLLD